MKKITTTIVMVIVAMTTFAQQTNTVKIGKFALNYATVSSGKGALSSGLDTKFDFTTEKNGVMSIQANSDRIAVHIGKKYGKFQYLQSIGVFKNVPWTGPMFLYQAGPVDFIVWNGIGLSKNKTVKEPGLKPNFFFSYEGVGVTVAKTHHIGFSAMWFTTNNVNWFAAYKKTFLVGEKSKIFGEITYNHNENIPMFVIGYTFKVK